LHVNCIIIKISAFKFFAPYQAKDEMDRRIKDCMVTLSLLPELHSSLLLLSKL